MNEPVTVVDRGSIWTFYSFKGGVGRSMALANVAALLAKWGKRVLIVDWDLEAPGIEKYFEVGGLSGRRKDTPGLVDLVGAYSGAVDGTASLEWRQCLIQANVKGGQKIAILHAGREMDDYSQRLRRIDWEVLFERNKFGVYLERLRREWLAEFDFVLIDSRTGITDIGGICTIFLPDVLVVLFTPNEQSLVGVKDVMRRARKAHAELTVDRHKLLTVPISARDETGNEYKLAEQWRNRFASELKEFFADWIPKEETAERVLNFIKIPYFAYWSFGERLPVMEEDPDNPKTLAFSYQLIARLVHSRLNWEEVRKGSMAAEAEGAQKAEAERLSAEAALAREKAQEMAAQREAEAQKAEEAQLRDRIENFMRSRFWPALTTARRMRLLALVLMTIGPLSGMYLVFELTRVMNDPGAFMSVVGWSVWWGLFTIAALIAFAGWKLYRRSAALIKYSSSELARFEAGLAPYAALPRKLAFALFAQEIESLIVDGAGKRGALDSGDAGPKQIRAGPMATPDVDIPPRNTSRPPGSATVSDAPLPPNYRGRSITLPAGLNEDPPEIHRGPYDVFISYAASHVTTTWLKDFFVPIFTSWLGEALGRDVKVAFFQFGPKFEGLESTRDLLKNARSMVAILTPTYFRTDATRDEWETFARTRRQALIPVLLHRADGYPSDAESMQWFDLSNYEFIGEGFAKSERYVDFQTQVRKLVDVVAEVLKGTAEAGAQTNNATTS
jgi:MinD-like ATPase involved in chromosome partitioning or flagellar assembly